MHKLLFTILFLIGTTISAQDRDIKNVRIDGNFNLPNIIAPLDFGDNLRYKTNASEYLPIKDDIFTEHVRIELTQKEEKKIKKVFNSNSKKLKKSKYSKLVEGSITSILEKDKEVWIGTTRGLYFYNSTSGKLTKHGSYGIDGPLSTHISAIAMDGKGKTWIDTPLGLNSVSLDGS